MALATRPKTTVSHKKRQGSHHRHSKHYLKTYWPYLPMLMIVVIGLMINSLWSSSGQVLGASSDFSSTSLLNDTNSDRLSAGEAALSLDPRLAAAAQAKANDIVHQNYWSHNSPDGRTPWSFISAAGYSYAVAGENLAYGFDNAAATEAGWMSSAEHKANILDSAYQNVGFGVANSPNYQGQGPETVVVAEYGAPSPAVANITFTVPQSTTPAAKSAAAQGATAPSDPTELAAQKVSRLQTLTGGQAAWTALAVSALTGAALAFLIIRHGWYLRRLLTRGELFISHHPVLDIVGVTIVTAGFLLTHATGVIR